MNLLNNVAFDNIIDETTAGTSDLDGLKVVDCFGYEGVCFIGIMDTVTAGGTLSMNASYSDSSGLTDMVSDTGTAVGSSAAGDTTDYEGKLLICDIHRPEKRYASVHVDRGTQDAEIRVIAIRYGSHAMPVAQSTEQYGVLDGEVFVRPTT